MSTSSIIKKISMIIIAITCFVLLFVYNRDNLLAKKQSGKDVFPDLCWEDVIGIAFYDFDESTYEIYSTQHIKEIQNILQSLTYREIENPEIEGVYSFGLYVSDECINFWISEDILGISGKTYQISDDSLDLQLSEFIKYNSEVL